VPLASGVAVWILRLAQPAAQGHTRRRELLKVKIQALFDASDGSYGYRRLHAELVLRRRAASKTSRRGAGGTGVDEQGVAE
jgi:HTH-like domain